MAEWAVGNRYSVISIQKSESLSKDLCMPWKAWRTTGGSLARKLFPCVLGFKALRK